MNTVKKGIIISLSIAMVFFSVSCTSSIVSFFKFIERSKAGLSEKSLQADKYTISYLEGGTGETIVLLHGFGANKYNWPRFSKFLSKEYHLVIPDLPGFGESTKIWTDSYDLKSQVTRLHAFMAKMGIKKFHIAGNSMGGAIAGLYAATYPYEILSLGLFDAYGVKQPKKSEMQIEFDKGNNPLVVEKESDYDTILDMVFVKKLDIPGPIKRYLARQAVENSKFNKKVFKELKPVLGDRLKNIRAKTLVLWGDTDRLIDVSAAAVFKKGIKNSRIIIMKDCGHSPMMERPEETADHYKKFLTSK